LKRTFFAKYYLTAVPDAVFGTLDNEDLSTPTQEALEKVIRAQNTLTNSTAFAVDREVPFYSYSDCLLVASEEWIPSIITALHFDTLAMQACGEMSRVFLKLRDDCRTTLTSYPMEKLLLAERRVRDAFSVPKLALHRLFDHLKQLLGQGRSIAVESFTQQLQDIVRIAHDQVKLLDNCSTQWGDLTGFGAETVTEVRVCPEDSAIERKRARRKHYDDKLGLIGSL